MPTTHAGSIYDVEGPLDSVWGEGGEGVRWEGGEASKDLQTVSEGRWQ